MKENHVSTRDFFFFSSVLLTTQVTNSPPTKTMQTLYIHGGLHIKKKKIFTLVFTVKKQKKKASSSLLFWSGHSTSSTPTAKASVAKQQLKYRVAHWMHFHSPTGESTCSAVLLYYWLLYWYVALQFSHESRFFPVLILESREKSTTASKGLNSMLTGVTVHTPSLPFFFFSSRKCLKSTTSILHPCSCFSKMEIR